MFSKREVAPKGAQDFGRYAYDYRESKPMSDPPKVGKTVDRFNQGCAFYTKAMGAWKDGDLEAYENALRKAATESIGALEWALKVYLRAFRADKIDPEDRPKLKEPTFALLTDLIQKYADPALDNDTISLFLEYRQSSRNPAEHDAAVPSADELYSAIQVIRRFITDYLKVNGTTISNVTKPTASPGAKPTPAAAARRPSAWILRTPLDFEPAISEGWRTHILVRIGPAAERRFRTIRDEIFADLDLMSPTDDQSTISLFVDGKRDALDELYRLGLEIFVIKRFGILKGLPDSYLTDYIIVPQKSYFRLGDATSKSQIHKFDPRCQTAVADLVSWLRTQDQLTLWMTNLAVAANYKGGTPWCSHCCGTELPAST